MFIVEYNRPMVIYSPEGEAVGEASQHGTRLVRELVHARQFSDFLKVQAGKEAGWKVEIREATSQDLWEIAQFFFVMSADAAAKQDINLLHVFAAKANVFADLAAGIDVDLEKFDQLIFGAIPEKSQGPPGTPTPPKGPTCGT